MSHVSQQSRDDHSTAARPIRPATLWFGVIGGPVAWATHVLVAWSFMEVSCLALHTGSVLQRGDQPGTVPSLVAYVATGVPWLVAVAALLTSLRLRSRAGRLDPDVLAEGRVGLMLVIGISLDLMSIAAITGSAVGLLVLEPCG
jgi:hypothetical protein